ncbi:fungal-specific transcription factor domain-containing protein [Aspergillus filifer]
MESPSVIRRRLRRRVADKDRRRAPRACVRCKQRKSKCVEVREGTCQSCLQAFLPCMRRIRASDTGTSYSTTQRLPQLSPSRVVQPIVGVHEQAVDSTGKHFLTKLRETFSLDARNSAADQVISSIQNPAGRAVPPHTDAYKLKKAATAFPPKPIADFLLSVCIGHGTDSFFYFDQAEFLAEIEDFYNNPASSLRTDASFLCLAHAAFALGSQWTTLEKPQNLSPTLLSDDVDPGRVFFKEARLLVPDLIDLPTFRSIQALFVLGVYLLPASAISSAYTYFGLAIRGALALNLHTNTEDNGLNPREIEVRRRLWWALYSLDRCSTVKLNRPRSVHPSIITVPLPAHLSVLDDTQRFNNIYHQIADAQLMLLLDRIAETSEWPNEKTAPFHFKEQLRQWKRSLPSTLCLDNIPPSASEYRATFHLHLNYYQCFISMGKLAVVSIVQATLRHAFGRDRKAPQIQEHVEFSARMCMKAARKILILFEKLYQSANLTRFSFSDFQGCSIATVVLLLSRILGRDGGTERQIEFGFDCLRRMAGGNPAAKMGVKFVEALASITNEALHKLNSTGPTACDQSRENTTEYPRRDSQYQDWAMWLARQEGLESNPVGLIEEVPMEKDITNVDSTMVDDAPPWWTTEAPELGPGPTHGTEPHEFLDDQTFLMGLTGLDIFTFSDFPE